MTYSVTFRKIINFYKKYGLRRFVARVLQELLTFMPQPDRNISVEPCFPFQVNKNQKTVLIVSHEASRTGAPILSMNLAIQLQKEMNVIVLFLGEGALLEELKNTGMGVFLVPVSKSFLHEKVDAILERNPVDYAIINSIESRWAIFPLWKRKIPIVSLVHEFAAYTKPNDAFVTTLMHSAKTIFSTRLTQKNAQQHCAFVENFESIVLPQGKCDPYLQQQSNLEELKKDRQKIEEITKNSQKVVLGVGFVQIRKGVDLFISCVRRIEELALGANYTYVWVGAGYAPDSDLNYSVYLKEQLERTGLANKVVMLEETKNIQEYYDIMDVMLLPSRLDPLPNVAIDTICMGKPVLCFKEGTGIAEILESNGLGTTCVAEYLDVEQMAQKCLALLQSEALMHEVREKSLQVANDIFCFEKYSQKVTQCLYEAAHERNELDKNVLYLAEQNILDRNFCSKFSEQNVQDLVAEYLLRWRFLCEARKPFSGFHPGIYAEENSVSAQSDPLVHFVKNGQPKGKWNYPVLTVDEPCPKATSPVKNAALHIHAYYPELVQELLDAVQYNTTRPAIFVSVDSTQKQNMVHQIFNRNKLKAVEIAVVPNRGRDIGPLMALFGPMLVQEYSFVGHVHTKRSFDLNDPESSEKWRRFAIENVLGGKQGGAMMDAILDKLQAQAKLGAVFPDDPFIVGWTKNFSKAEELIKKNIGFHLPKHFNFPVGSYFWMRSDVLKFITSYGFSWEDFPEEPLPYDGTILHAMERIFGLLPAYAGYTTLSTYIKGFVR